MRGDRAPPYDEEMRICTVLWLSSALAQSTVLYAYASLWVMPGGGNQRHDRKTIFSRARVNSQIERKHAAAAPPRLLCQSNAQNSDDGSSLSVYFFLSMMTSQGGSVALARALAAVARQHDIFVPYGVQYKLYGGTSGNVRNHLRCWATDGPRGARTKPIGLAAVAQPRQQGLPRLFGPTRRAPHFPTHPRSLGPTRFNQRRVVFRTTKRGRALRKFDPSTSCALGGGAAKGYCTYPLPRICVPGTLCSAFVISTAGERYP